MSRMKLIHILSNFTVADDYLGELVDTSKIDSALRDKMVSVIKEVAGDVLPLYDDFTGVEAKELLCNSNDSDTMKEIVKFACAVYADEELVLDEFGIFEPTDNYEEIITYDICFPDAEGYTCCWPADFGGEDKPRYEVKDGVGIVPKRRKVIIESAFEDNKDLVSITVPSYITEIGDFAFSGCTGLTSISIPEGVTSIGDNAFYDCAGLTSTNIPSSVKKIGEEAFRGCTGLVSITIPASVESIGDYAFCACADLESVTILSARTYIGDDVFGDCPSLKEVNVPPGTIDYYRSFFDNTFDKYIIKEKEILK